MKQIEYSRLSATERYYYEYMLHKLKEYNFTLTFDNISYEFISKVYEAVIQDNPQLFWLTGGYKGLTRTNGKLTKLTFTVGVRDGLTQSSIRTMDEKFTKQVNSIVNVALRYKTDFERALFVHDYIVDKTDYITTAPNRYNAYGCLIEQRAVCSGYSAAFQVIMQKLGIICGRISGTESNNRSRTSTHQWNYIYIDGEFFYIDVTWDDPLVDGIQTSDNKTHDYFCITTKELLLTHRIIENFFIPTCTSTRYDYYVHNGFYLDRYSFKDVSVIASRQLRISGKFNIKFSSNQELKKAVYDLVDNQKVYSIPGISNRITYSNNKAGLVLKISSK